MAIFSRKKRSRHTTGMSPVMVGVIAIVLLSAATFFGFSRLNPFADPYELNAVFETANNLKPRSPVRIAGVEVGKVKKVEPIDGGAARVTMDLKEEGLPIHQDATLKVRPRIFLEGNFFIDLEPGSPSAPEIESGATVPSTQTAAPVQFGEVLTALQSDTREDLQVFLDEYSQGLAGKGAKGFNDSIRYWEPAYRSSSLANEAALGEDPDRDLQRVLSGQARTAAALAANEEALKGVVTNLNVTAGALASEDVALEASVPALRDTLDAAQPALASLNDALPSLRAFARAALPGVRSSDATLAEAQPFIEQARKLVSKRELRGAAAELRRQIPNLARLTKRSIPLLDQGRQLSACTNKTLVPFLGQVVPDPDFPGNDNRPVRQHLQSSFPGLAGESRLSDGNNQFFHAASTAGGNQLRPGPPPDLGATPPPHRPDVPCETQELPNLNAPGGPTSQFQSSTRRPDIASEQAVTAAQARSSARTYLKALPEIEKAIDKTQLKALGKDAPKNAEREQGK